VVARQVVLGEEVHLERDTCGRAEGGLLDRPRLSVQQSEVPPFGPRDVLVRHPLLGCGQVPIEVLRGRRFELSEQSNGVE
jgi:hypothetical protein